MILLEVISFLFFIAFFVAAISMVFVYSGRSSVKQKIKNEQLEIYEENFAKGLTDFNYNKATKEAHFFIRKDWPELRSLDLKLALKKQRRVELLCYTCFFFSFLCFFLVAIISVMHHEN